MAQRASSRTDIRRTIWQALTLNEQFYQTAQGDPATCRTALTVVIIAAVSRAIASIVISLLNRATMPTLIVTTLLGILSVIVGYYFWTFTIWKAGQWLNLNPPTYAKLRCPVGFAYAPQVLNFLILLPLFGRPVELILSWWTFLAVSVAVAKAMNISTLRAALISFVSFPVVQIVPILIQVIGQQFTP